MILKAFISRRTRKNQTQEVLYMVVRESLAEEVICGIKHKEEVLAMKKTETIKNKNKNTSSSVKTSLSSLRNKIKVYSFDLCRAVGK